MDPNNSMLSKTVLEAKQDSISRCDKQSVLQEQPIKKCRATKNALQLNLWENLDPYILQEIFSRVPLPDVIMSVSSVCQSWEAACWDYLFWSRNVLDLSITGAALGRFGISDVVSLLHYKDFLSLIFGDLVSSSTDKYNDMVTHLVMRKLQRIMDGQGICRFPLKSWRDSIHTIILPYDLQISNACLVYIAERTPGLECLFLMCPSKITVDGFAKAINKWKHVKEIHIGPLKDDDLMHCFIEEMGRNCQELVTLHIHQKDFELDKTSAQRIAKRLPGLKKIGFELGTLRPSGVTTFYIMCLQLEEINFDNCDMGSDYIDDFPEIEKIYPKVSGNFCLTWTVDTAGYAKWEIQPNPVTVEYYYEHFEMFGLNRNRVYEMLDPKYVDRKRAMYQSDFNDWIINAKVIPRRQL